jgi:hypothetical protein
MDMSVKRPGTIPQRLLSREGLDATAGYFVMDWAAVAVEIFGDLLIAVTFYTAMVIAGLTVDLFFNALGLQRTVRDAKVVEASIHFNYTTVLNIVFLGLAGFLVYRFVSTGGTAMLRAMNRPAGAHDEHQIAHGS